MNYEVGKYYYGTLYGGTRLIRILSIDEKIGVIGFVEMDRDNDTFRMRIGAAFTSSMDFVLEASPGMVELFREHMNKFFDDDFIRK